MAAFGGVSYATNSVSHSVGVSNNNKGWSYTPSCDQYGKQGHKPGKPGTRRRLTTRAGRRVDPADTSGDSAGRRL